MADARLASCNNETHKRRRQMFRRTIAAIAATCLALAFGSAAADDYPSRPISLVHGFGAGGNADVLSRLIGERLQASMGQPVVVEAKTGAGGTIASNLVAKAKPDGYTLIMQTGGHAVSGALYKALPYDTVEDFDWVSTVTTFPFVIGVRAENPVQTLAELLERAKREPGKVTFTSVGVGSTQHLTGELLASTAGVQMLHIPYRGGGATIAAVLAGDVEVLVDTITVAGPHIKAGKIRPLAVTSAQPWPALQGVPTVASALPGFEVRSWLGIAAPKGLPAPVLARLNAEIRKALEHPETKARIEAAGSEARGNAPEEMKKMVASEVARWQKVVADAGIERR
ncbi:tripartite tricarboxylate transporter substrate binding protein [Burkholderiaceae bacterium FT117]|uniref:Bug family tripartite tricarboxylate transporter substrate binding protein n=1 Tax=Zeimonas sediminis TaxID=2944268 RepID=UPI002343213D|nr:tripartite tricarboxylate transporter substrate binding protein [Zeimonas sediminis]MCM5571516.1 tripartite tricarboxylate transporter substrate binding protein [Zeimonas sediminis]